jgi:hypothetical protein
MLGGEHSISGTGVEAAIFSGTLDANAAPRLCRDNRDQNCHVQINRPDRGAVDRHSPFHSD